MKLFSDCSGPCWACKCSGFCLAGHGDDDFCLISRKEAQERLQSGNYNYAREELKEFIKTGIVLDEIKSSKKLTLAGVKFDCKVIDIINRYRDI